MEFQIGLLQIPVLVSCIVSLFVLFMVMFRLRQRGMVFFLYLMIAVTVWTGTYFLEVSAVRLPVILFFSNFKYLGVSLAPVFFLLFTLSFSRWKQEGSIRALLPRLIVVPVVVQLVIWIPPLHALFFPEFQVITVDGFRFIEHVLGPLFWVHVVYSYALLLAGAGMLFRQVLSGNEMVGSMAGLIAACLVPFLSNMLHLFHLTGPIQFLDITPVSFSVSGALFLFVVIRYRIEDYVPITHQLILDNLKEGILVLDHRMRVVEANSSAAVLFKNSMSEVIGRPVSELSVTNNEVVDRYRDIYDVNDEVEFIIRGERRFFEISISPIRDKRLPSPGRVVVLRDITERRKAESQAAKAQRLESLELLAGGVAHDFNNLLSAIFGNISLANLENQDPVIADYLQQMENATGQAIKLTRQLLSFSSKGCPEAEFASLKELVVEAITFFLRGSNIKYSLSLSDDLWNIFVDPQQISQVLNNLVTNSMQAQPSGGALAVTAENKTFEADNWLGLEPGRYVHVLFHDEGPGIDPKILPRIFDPYFTTKKTGSGLGLAAAYSIVRNNHGAIYAEAGPGARLHLYLPAVPPSGLPHVSVGDEVTSLQELKVDGIRRIALMDDDRDVRLVMRTILNRMGYQVATFSDAVQVMEFLNAPDGLRTDVIIADLTVPGGKGACELVSMLRERKLALPVVVASGYTEKDEVREYKRYGFAAAITKPFTPRNVQNALLVLNRN